MNTRLIAVFIAVFGGSICSATDFNVAAHEDDDLLFMNPEIADSIAAGNTVHTVYLTAGDLEGKPWLEGREEEMKAAYRLMAGVSPDASWLPITVVTAAEKSIQAFDLEGTRVRLIFMRLPDGNVGGQSDCSLQKLWDGTISSVSALDADADAAYYGLNRGEYSARCPSHQDHQTYTKDDLVAAIADLMHQSGATQVRTLDATRDHSGEGFSCCDRSDHSDHHHAALFAHSAASCFGAELRIESYRGYNITLERENLAEIAAREKRRFYSHSICRSECEVPLAYSPWLDRLYTAPMPAAATLAISVCPPIAPTLLIPQ